MSVFKTNAIPEGEEGQVLKYINGQPVFVNPSEIFPQVNLYADLPDPAANNNSLYYVTTSSGVWLINRKSRGFYRSNGSVWEYAGEMVESFETANFRIYDSVDTTKQISVNLAGLSSFSTKAWTAENSDIYLTNNVVLHKQICDGSVLDGHPVILDSSGVAQSAVATSFNSGHAVGVISKKHSLTVCDILLRGVSSSLYSGLTPGLRYFVSATTVGAITPTPPANSGNLVLEIGQAISSTSLYINPRVIVIRS